MTASIVEKNNRTKTIKPPNKQKTFVTRKAAFPPQKTQNHGSPEKMQINLN